MNLDRPLSRLEARVGLTSQQTNLWPNGLHRKQRRPQSGKVLPPPPQFKQKNTVFYIKPIPKFKGTQQKDTKGTMHSTLDSYNPKSFLSKALPTCCPSDRSRTGQRCHDATANIPAPGATCSESDPPTCSCPLLDFLSLA